MNREDELNRRRYLMRFSLRMRKRHSNRRKPIHLRHHQSAIAILVQHLLNGAGKISCTTSPRSARRVFASLQAQTLESSAHITVGRLCAKLSCWYRADSRHLKPLLRLLGTAPKPCTWTTNAALLKKECLLISS